MDAEKVCSRCTTSEHHTNNISNNGEETVKLPSPSNSLDEIQPKDNVNESTVAERVKNMHGRHREPSRYYRSPYLLVDHKVKLEKEVDGILNVHKDLTSDFENVANNSKNHKMSRIFTSEEIASINYVKMHASSDEYIIIMQDIRLKGVQMDSLLTDKEVGISKWLPDEVCGYKFFFLHLIS